MRDKRAILEAMALTAGTVLALAGSIAFVLPATELTTGTGPLDLVEAWVHAGGVVAAAEDTPEPEALRAWHEAGLDGDPTAVRFVDSGHGTLARALVGEEGAVLVYESGLHARLVHPAIGSASLHGRGDYYLARPGVPIERRKLD